MAWVENGTAPVDIIATKVRPVSFDFVPDLIVGPAVSLIPYFNTPF